MNKEIKYPVSLPTALKVVGSLKVKAINKLENTKSEKEKIGIIHKIDMYLAEERMLYGIDDFQRLSVMDKIVNLYSPILKKEYQDLLNKKIDI